MLNALANTLEVISDYNAEKLRDKLKGLTRETEVVAIYSMGQRHYAWIRTLSTIKRVKRTKGSLASDSIDE